MLCSRSGSLGQIGGEEERLPNIRFLSILGCLLAKSLDMISTFLSRRGVCRMPDLPMHFAVPPEVARNDMIIFPTKDLKYKMPPQPWRFFCRYRLTPLSRLRYYCSHLLHANMKEALVNIGPKVRIVESPIPVPEADQVVTKVIVSGSNPKDWKHPAFTKQELNQGDDIAGVVHAVGSNVVEFKPGDRVAAFHQMRTPGGSYAEYALSWSHTTFHIPKKTTFEGPEQSSVAQGYHLTDML